MEHKKIVITGGSRGIGEALAFSRAFAATNAAHEEQSFEGFLKFMEEQGR